MDQLSHEPAEGHGVIGVTRVGLPLGTLVLEQADHRRPGDDVANGGASIEKGQPGAVA